MRVLRPEEVITFGAKGSVREFSPRGFDLDEPDSLSWTNRPTASLDFLAMPARTELAVELRVIPFLADGKVMSQQVSFYINGVWVGFETLVAGVVLRFDVPRAAFAQRSNRFSIAIPTAKSPKELGLSDDVRQLGLALQSFALIPC